ncbi:M3 family oligoendopeptidase [Deltaproteobacteria bacterium OttesenSCG-928-K17]|nr:M3 family oligoendopeptidase [Deltaproteobacteria bacterium OttesenSCG-928-K17]
MNKDNIGENIKTNGEIPDWNLDQLYVPASAGLEKDLADLDAQVLHFTRWRAVLDAGAPSAEDFRLLVAELESLTSLSNRLSAFAALSFAQNTQDQKAQAFMARIDEKMADLGNKLLFFEIWWKELDDQAADPLMAALPDFAYWLRRTRSFKPHTLAEPEEKVINLKNITGHDALIALYDSITNRYRFRTDFLPGGNGEEVTRDQLMVHARSADPEIRAGAYQELYRVFGNDGPILGQIYQTVARDWRIENLRLRNYASPIAVRHQANDLGSAAVDSLLETARANIKVFSEFFRLKASALKLGRLRRYDLYAPLTADDEIISFQDGRGEVMAAFRDFSPRFEELAAGIISRDRFSARPKIGKQGGAFCYSMLPGDSPWVLMTYNGRRQDLFTMAHELGHGIHSQLAAGHNVFHFHATLPLAETASTFGEMLLADRLMKRASSPRQKADMLFHLLDDAYATIGRQAFFALFEIKAHDLIENGATVDELAEAYYANLADQFGDAVELADEFRWEWVSIPHIYHTPFYVYAYSFGQLLVYSLWRQYQKEGRDFTARLTDLLSKGGSAPPETIVAESGLGPLNHEFWQGGFEVIAGMLGELKAALAD